MKSMKLLRLASACNKYVLPSVLCLWGCSEHIFSCGHLSIDIMFQRFLPEVELVTIHSLETTKFIKYCCDNFIRFDNDYDYWILNKECVVRPSLY